MYTLYGTMNDLLLDSLSKKGAYMGLLKTLNEDFINNQFKNLFFFFLNVSTQERNLFVQAFKSRVTQQFLMRVFIFYDEVFAGIYSFMFIFKW